MSRCRSCGAEIKWVRTFSGKAMPVDPEQISFEADGGREIFVTASGAVAHGTRVPDGHRTGYISHFATCPNAAAHRK